MSSSHSQPAKDMFSSRDEGKPPKPSRKSPPESRKDFHGFLKGSKSRAAPVKKSDLGTKKGKQELDSFGSTKDFHGFSKSSKSTAAPIKKGDLVTKKKNKEVPFSEIVDRMIVSARSQYLPLEESDLNTTTKPKELSDYLESLSRAENVTTANRLLSRFSGKQSGVDIEYSAIQANRRMRIAVEELTYLRAFLRHFDYNKISDHDQMEFVDNIIHEINDAEEVLYSLPIKAYKERRKGIEYLLAKPWVATELERIINRMRKIRELIKTNMQTQLVVTVETPCLGREEDNTVLEMFDYILNGNLITREDVIETVLSLREGYLADTYSLILSSYDSPGDWSQSERVCLLEIEDIFFYTASVAEKFIKRIERPRNVWAVLYPFEQHGVEMNLMKEIEHINSKFGDAVYRRWTFGDGGKLLMGDITGSSSKRLTFFAQFVSSWRFLNNNLSTTRRYLAVMKAFLDDIDGTVVEGLNQRQRVWVGQVREVTRKGYCLVEEENGFFFLLSRIVFAKDIDYLLNEIIDISKRKEIYAIANIQGERRKSFPSSPSIQGSEREIMVEVEQEGDNSGAEESPLIAQPNTFSYRHITELEKEFQSIKGEKQLMNALFDDVQEIG
ncbi:uncharacterized protein LOC114191481 [Vigna unguiculata]|uniref:Uncharacterized protein n=1 Tax=Vigna unguiculata TaxID=3917 RepID=A0A4D6N1V7_VIGUN|nr:uncharacterized protein LOC114191481 [Vigna unguiculata]XP_027936467.1 uncharacterized protein LOC114191481 [Vigna unguiculata]XP_027936468.1 uncharacterized protein LOC114191481 [Vigna unguiculata]QCE07790.1 hypothetical protein DEO72_LG9g2810 [Vigna unguiculata]